MISTGLQKGTGPAQILQKASMHGASVKSSNSIYYKLINKHKEKSKNLRSVWSIVGSALCLPGSLAAA